MRRLRTGLRTTVPVATGVAAASGAIVAYLVTGEWLYSIAGAGLAAWAAALLAAESVGSTISQAARRLNAVAAGAEAEAIATGPLEELSELDEAIDSVAEALSHRHEEASQERVRLLAALNSSADAVVGVDRDGNVCFANIAAERLLFRPGENLVGRPFSWLFPNADVVEALRVSTEAGRREVRLIERPLRRFLEVSVNPIVGGDWAAFVVFHDLTDVKRAEEMRRDFVANVSHELRTPLASIRAVLDTLEGGAISDPVAGRDFVSRAQTEVDRLAHMVTELLELSRIEAREPSIVKEPVSLAGVVTGAVDRMQSQAKRAGVTLSTEIQSGLPAVLGDSERLERAIVNLVHNALKFTPSGGHVEVLVTGQEGLATVEVRDNGVGIDERDLPRIFERFYKSDSSRRTDGSGLGLSLVKHTAEAHEGSVSVVSQLGRGTTFALTLPLMDRTVASSDLDASGSRSVI